MCFLCVCKKNADMDTDVALVSNFEIPNNFKNILNSSGVQIIKADFNQFNFNGKYAWSLAFFKLNALFYVVKEFEYDNYAYLDSDVFIQGNFKYLD